ncbi:hypothetical protein N39L_56060 [Limnospira platensis NIES-39]|jgi:hypothetical protein|uniref:Transposase n=1 Tax=Limnospira platensis NIES-46 TaxID=1236695 RepID=A0A5M3T848_LIMPL|nr:hypothetical protein N39L_56060 [Arthrospira platensis NIES-39]GCE94110.1 hypothetical protein NIES46_21620 [Arthrospira platensis NIES-46]
MIVTLLELDSDSILAISKIIVTPQSPSICLQSTNMGISQHPKPQTGKHHNPQSGRDYRNDPQLNRLARERYN